MSLDTPHSPSPPLRAGRQVNGILNVIVATNFCHHVRLACKRRDGGVGIERPSCPISSASVGAYKHTPLLSFSPPHRRREVPAPRSQSPCLPVYLPVCQMLGGLRISTPWIVALRVVLNALRSEFDMACPRRKAELLDRARKDPLTARGNGRPERRAERIAQSTTNGGGRVSLAATRR